MEKCCWNLCRILGMKVVNQLNALLCLKKKGEKKDNRNGICLSWSYPALENSTYDTRNILATGIDI